MMARVDGESGTPSAAAAVEHPTRHRLRRLVLVATICVTLVGGLMIGGAWYFSGVLIDGLVVDRGPATFDTTVVAVSEGEITLRTSDSEEDQSVRVKTGLAVADGSYVQLGPATRVSGTETTRPILAVDGELPQVGSKADIDSYYFADDPLRGLGLDYSVVDVQTPLGAAPAWFVPGSPDEDTWVIYSHGRGDTPRQGLRMLQTANARGYPALLVTVRDDAGAPAEDDISNMGATEWRDLEAAVRFALDEGATDVVLLGTSAGGAVSLAFLEQSDLADVVVGMFLDAPVTSFPATVDLGAQEQGLPFVGLPIPGALITLAKWFTEQRVELDFEATDYVARAGQLDVPTVIVHGTPDATNPIAASEAFAAAAPDGVVRLEVFDDAEHTWAWNDETRRYRELLAGHLEDVAPQ